MGQHCMKKAAEITWRHTSKYANIILQMGTFHTIMTLLSIIRKRSQDAGLRDPCIESGIIANGSVSGVLEGRMYSWAVRFTTFYMTLYFVSPGKVSLLGWKLTPLQMHAVSALPDQISDAREEISQPEFD